MAQPPYEFDEDTPLFSLEEAVVLDDTERKAMADIDAGRYVSHAAVMRWVASWGSDNELPPPECGE